MRALLLATTLIAAPLAAWAADEKCVLPDPISPALPFIEIAPPVTVDRRQVPLMPTINSVNPNSQATAASAVVVPANRPIAQPPAAAPAGALPTISAADVAASPALAHMARAGAVLFDLGTAHGLRSILARGGSQVLVVHLPPDGLVTVSGLPTDISVEQLQKIGGTDLTELPRQHGLRILFLRNGSDFQVFYASPDDERVIPGVMWDSSGRNLTRDLVSSIPGTVPTVTIGREGDPSLSSADVVSASPLAIAQAAYSGRVGRTSAPELWMLVDPQCSYSVRAMQQLTPAVLAGKVQIHVIPLSILDAEDNGMSTRVALDLLSVPADQMVASWQSGRSPAPPQPSAEARLQGNMGAAAAIHLQGTPTFLWRKVDGKEGRLDGVPSDLNAMLASIGP